jgi:L-phenylalanine/L-methionine N-acetyltransferase
MFASLKAAIDMADSLLQHTRHELTVHTANVAAVALSEKCGFVIEGSWWYACRAGAYVDVDGVFCLRPR